MSIVCCRNKGRLATKEDCRNQGSEIFRRAFDLEDMLAEGPSDHPRQSLTLQRPQTLAVLDTETNDGAPMRKHRAFETNRKYPLLH